MTDSKEQEELSMEEILASIRKIISEKEEEPLADEDESVAEDDAEVKKESSPWATKPVWPWERGAAAEDVSEETPEEPPEEEGGAEEKVLELTQMINENGTVVDLTAPPEEESPEEAAPEPTEELRATEALVRKRLIEGRTVEDLIKDILRPLLKQWLDDNLSGLVERLVKEESEKLSERARNL